MKGIFLFSLSYLAQLNAFVPDKYISARAVNVPQPHEHRMLRIALSVCGCFLQVL